MADGQKVHEERLRCDDRVEVGAVHLWQEGAKHVVGVASGKEALRSLCKVEEDVRDVGEAGSATLWEKFLFEDGVEGLPWQDEVANVALLLVLYQGDAHVGGELDASCVESWKHREVVVEASEACPGLAKERVLERKKALQAVIPLDEADVVVLGADAVDETANDMIEAGVELVERFAHVWETLRVVELEMAVLCPWLLGGLRGGSIEGEGGHLFVLVLV